MREKLRKCIGFLISNTNTSNLFPFSARFELQRNYLLQFVLLYLKSTCNADLLLFFWLQSAFYRMIYIYDDVSNKPTISNTFLMSRPAKE